jgi:hypothetical protein
MSRRAKDLSTWTDLKHVWIENFLDGIKGEGLNLSELTEKFFAHPNLSLGLAFPAALPKLNRIERRMFSDLASDLKTIFVFHEKKDERIFQILLNRRGFFATRGKMIRYWPQFVPVFYGIAVSAISGVRPRFNR